MSRAIAMACLLCCAPSLVRAASEEPSFEALGQAPVVGGDRVRARERALEEAMRQAVEQAAQSVLDPQALAQRAADLKLRVYPRAKSYIVTYRVLDESEVGGVFQMHVSAQVALSRLQRELAGPALPVLPRLSSKLRGVVCARVEPGRAGALGGIPDSDVARIAAQVGGEADKALREALAARLVEALPAPATCSEAAAAEAAKAGAAQAALVAAIEIAPAGPIRGTDRVAAHVKVTVRLVEPGGRASGAEDSEKESYGPSLDRAAVGAAKEALSVALVALGPKLGSLWTAAAPQTGVTVHLSRIGRHADYVAVLRALQALPGVTAVEPRRLSRGEAELLVRTNVAAPQLGATLQRMPPRDIKISITPSGDGTLSITITAESTPEGG